MRKSTRSGQRIKSEGRKARTLRVTVKDFALSRANYRSWADDVVASVLPFFTRDANQTPCLALGKSIGKVPRRALVRAFKKRHERVTVTSAIPRAARCVAADLSVVKSACGTCGDEPAKELVSRIAFFMDGRPVEFGGVPRKTVAVCPACNSVSDAPVQGPATHDLNEKSGSGEPLLSEIDSL